MTFRFSLRSLAVAMGAMLLAPAAFAQPAANTPDPNHPGKAIYDRTCAACHAAPAANSRAATFGQITGTAPAQLRAILTEGVMKPMAASLSPQDMTSLIGYLTSGQQAVNANWTDAMMCAADNRTVNTAGAIAFGGFGVDPHSTRSLTAKQAGLTRAQMSKLEIAWAIGFPQTQSLGTGAVVLGDTVFVNGGGKLLALDAAKGCARWVKTIASRNTPQIADLQGRKVLLLASSRNDLTMVDAKTGDTVWSVNAKPTGTDGIGIRGGVVVYKDKIIVPYSASGVGAGQNAKFECCTGHGAVVALSLKDGKKLWEYHTMKDAEYTGKVSKTGVKQRGPSGAPIWALPTIDEKRNRVIVATGENTSHPGTETSDAIIALDLDTGKQVWVFQAMAADVWNMSCNDRELPKSGPNCPNLYDDDKGRDFDFGATPMLLKGAGGKDIIVNGQKSGHVWAIDAATGKKLWVDRVGEGSALGGVHWGVASDGQLAFVPIADSMFTPEEQGKVAKPGVYAYRLTDGKQVWAHPAKADCPPARKPGIVACETKYGFSAAPIVVDGALVTATLDGKVVVLDGKTGAVLKTIDTTGPVKTVNGVPGKGGSIDSHALSAGDGMVFVTSGYGSFTQTPGNVLIAFKPAK
jgi:polyvinyl alcohol dehydrogenase (cytochrome)